MFKFANCKPVYQRKMSILNLAMEPLKKKKKKMQLAMKFYLY